MNKIKISVVIILNSIFLVSSAQDSLNSTNLAIATLKLELLASKIQLIESQLNNLESIPYNIEKEVSELQEKLDHIDRQSEKISNRFVLSKISNSDIKYSTSVKVNFIRLMQSTLDISYEKAIGNRWSIELSPMITYATTNGFSNGYLKSQNLEAYNDYTGSFEQISGDMLSGIGLTVAAKQYLLSDLHQRYRAPFGLYAAPQLMYRKVYINGKIHEYYSQEYIEREVKQKLDVYAGGVLLGYKFTILKVLSFDIYACGQMRLSKYENEKEFTKYKSWQNIDYSGVLPTLGIQIGILK